MKKSIIIMSLILAVLMMWNLESAFSYVAEGDTAPDFTKMIIDGTTISLSDYLGKVVLLNFFYYY